jgi:hypothetical protein
MELLIQSLWHVIDTHLNDEKTYLFSAPLKHDLCKKIVGTFFVASSIHISAKTSYNDPLTGKFLLCTYEEYLVFWKARSVTDS